MFGALDDLIERRIKSAQAEGQFDGLPGEGRPLDLDDDRLVPEDLRVAYRVLRNAGLVPPEVIKRRELAQLRAAAVDALAQGDEASEKQARRRLMALTLALEARGVELSDPGLHEYAGAIRARYGAG
ncbi:MAG: DUF1992 domain-containing protein [Burkholderiaceae bacterium]